MTLSSLIERIEAGEGPSFGLEREIFHAIYGDAARGQIPSAYTGQIDRALGLVPEGWWHGYHTSDAGFEAHCFEPIPDSALFEGRGATPALALCAASLRARSKQGEA